MLERIGPKAPESAEFFGIRLAGAAIACFAVVLGGVLVLQWNPSLLERFRLPAIVLGVATPIVSGVTFVLALWVNDRDKRVPQASRRRWLLALLLLNHFAGPAYFVIRAIRRHRTVQRSGTAESRRPDPEAGQLRSGAESPRLGRGIGSPEALRQEERRRGS